MTDPTPLPELEDVLTALMQREAVFHRREFDVTRTDFERMTAEDFWETGASGKRYSRQFVLDELEKRSSQPHQDVWAATDFQCRQLGPDTYLLTYTLMQDAGRLTRRSSIWRHMAGEWKILYHQGTLVENT